MISKNYIGGLLIGGLVGGALGILFAPKAGRELRQDIRGQSENLYKKAKGKYEETVTTVENVVKQAKDSLADKKVRLGRGIEAGVSAYKQ
ncbi:MAG: YtxH domain-containing protein [Deltaproteobacteria bacterium]|nr:YtxH domain-containing protein [Deltaproteobacteria bacterium]